MKSMMQTFTWLSMGLLLYSCNEKISPDIGSGSATTIASASVPDEYYFKVTNQSATILNFNLHKTGQNNAATECKISTSAYSLSSSLYIGDIATAHDSKAYDISCYLEAEELSLYFNGLSFAVEASKNTCEYIAYSPYSYFDKIPGSSTTTFSGYTCDDVSTAQVNANATARATLVALGMTTDGVNAIPCDTMVDTSVAVGSRLVISTDDAEETLCRFNYDGISDYQNCDTGTISYIMRNVKDGKALDTDPVLPVVEISSKGNFECGGETAACVEGAIRSINSDATKMSEILSTTLNTDFTKTYTLPSLMDKKQGMHDIVNFRKGLASLDLNFLDYTTVNESNWSDINYNMSFDPNLMEKYAANKSPDNVTIISPAAILTQSQLNGYTATPHAADPYLGTSSRVNPFYTFYCLDRAYEIKARIRMVVRDWDKVFSTGSSDLELISDSYKAISARRQDLPSSEEEFPDDPGSFNVFNDKDDWDVLVEMNRTDPNLTGVYDPGDTLWSPTAGWWDPSIFPSEGPPGT